jgi:hypothetical protein
MNDETAQLIAIGDIDPISKEKFIDEIEEEETKYGEEQSDMNREDNI